MKKIKILVILFLASIPGVNILAGSDPHDSLLSDGSNGFRTETYYSNYENECEYKITYVKGTATGMIRKRHIYDVCGQNDTIDEYENGALVKNSVIKGGEMVKTGPESTARIELSDGSVIVLGPNTNYSLPVNVCDIIRKSFLDCGSVWTKIKKAIGGGKFEISTERMVDGNRGTEYSVEIIEENGIKYDVTKVFEGSVDVSLKNINTESYDSKTEQIDKLEEDLEAGKITQDEYNKKAMELFQSLKSGSTNLTLSKIVEAGYMLKTDGKVLGDPVPFNTSEDSWFKINE